MTTLPLSIFGPPVITPRPPPSTSVTLSVPSPTSEIVLPPSTTIAPPITTPPNETTAITSPLTPPPTTAPPSETTITSSSTLTFIDITMTSSPSSSSSSLAGDITQLTFTNSSQATTILQSPNAITSPMSSPTTTAPMSVSTTILKFKLPSAFIACSSGVINWNYTGEATLVKLTLMVDNDVPQDVPSPYSINQTLSSQIDPTSGSFLWHPVNVPQGSYQLISSLPPYGQSNQSLPFHVKEGTNSSCFIPVTKPTHTGVIVGGIVVAIAVTIVLCIGCLYAYRRRRNYQSSISSHIKTMVAYLRSTYFDSVALAHSNTRQNFQKLQECEINASDSLDDHEPRPIAHLEQAITTTYSRPGSSLRSLDSYSDPFIDSHFTPEHASSYTESHLSPRSSSWSFTAVSQPYTRVSAAETLPYNIEDTSNNRSTFSSSSTALPLYGSPTSLPPSYHTL